MFNEMILKKGTAWNSGRVDGGKDSSIASEQKALLNGSESISGDKECDVAKSVQQYRFRSTEGKTIMAFS